MERRPTEASPRAPAGGRPERTCIGCRRRFGISELIRISVAGSGALVAGPGSGRGAWLCRRTRGCFERAAERRAFSRALRAEIGDEAVAALQKVLWPE